MFDNLLLISLEVKKRRKMEKHPNQNLRRRKRKRSAWTRNGNWKKCLMQSMTKGIPRTLMTLKKKCINKHRYKLWTWQYIWLYVFKNTPQSLSKGFFSWRHTWHSGATSESTHKEIRAYNFFLQLNFLIPLVVKKNKQTSQTTESLI